jgi:hypothetical protein
MRNILVFSALFVLLFSCHSEVPSLPEYSTVQFCEYKNANNETVCKSTYFISKEDCEFVGGDVVPACPED